jgi:hypothetical protein
MKKLPVLANFMYDRIGSWRNCNPFVMAFCITSKKYFATTKFIIKGGSKDVEKEVKKRHVPMVVWWTYWWRGHCRTIGPTFSNFRNYSVTGDNPYVHGIQPWRINQGPRFYRRYEVRYQQKVWFTVRRFPRKWLPEYDQMIAAPQPLGIVDHLNPYRYRG